ncbi:DsbA family protein [Pseudodesulfovibrio indicus]|uniref:DsbA family oxidoreductase n=1 Tax=Pseudodesulfovibrio indicus TaxID=1716143 RepID=UPI00292CD385|nr:DsbA family protein [Pseudodesulfovibrio indicus]
MTIQLTIFSDFACPFCFIGKGIVDHLRDEFGIEDLWLPHELHPETPPEGRDLDELFDRFDIDQVTMTCNLRGKPYGIRFGEMTRLPNTRLALEGAEFARDKGRFHEFHGRMYRALFTEGRDIGDPAEILAVAEASGLDPAELAPALADHRFAARVAEGSEAAKRAGVTALPTFIIEGGKTITGAVDETLFRNALQEAANRD